MADKKITALTATTSVVDADIFPVVVDVAGTPVTKKITALNLGTYVQSSIVFPSGVNALDDLADVTTPAPAAGDVLKWNGTAWVNAAGYALLASPTFTGTVSGVSKTMVGLGSVDNTADTAKPVSAAQQTALDLKSNLASPTLTGTPLAPTATAGTSTTQIATTAFADPTGVQYVLASAVFNS